MVLFFLVQQAKRTAPARNSAAAVPDLSSRRSPCSAQPARPRQLGNEHTGAKVRAGRRKVGPGATDGGGTFTALRRDPKETATLSHWGGGRPEIGRQSRPPTAKAPAAATKPPPPGHAFAKPTAAKRATASTANWLRPRPSNRPRRSNGSKRYDVPSSALLTDLSLIALTMAGSPPGPRGLSSGRVPAPRRAAPSSGWHRRQTGAGRQTAALFGHAPTPPRPG